MAIVANFQLFDLVLSCFVDPEWRDKFLGIDAESHGRVTAFFIERKLKELRRTGLKRSQLSQEEPVADCLLGELQPKKM